MFNLCFLVFVINFVPLRTQSSVPIFTWEQDYWLDYSLPTLDSPFSSPGHLCLLPIPPLLYPTLNLFVCSGLWRILRDLISAWICLSPFHSPFSSPGHLCLLPPSSLLFVTPCTSPRGPECGEHIELITG